MHELRVESRIAQHFDEFPQLDLSGNGICKNSTAPAAHLTQWIHVHGIWCRRIVRPLSRRGIAIAQTTQHGHKEEPRVGITMTDGAIGLIDDLSQDYKIDLLPMS